MVIAQPAARAGTGMLQDKPLKYPARAVLRTRTRLLRAVLVPPALATQATVATPVTHTLHALRVQRASTNLQQAMVIALAAARANTGMLQDKVLSHPAWRAARESIGYRLESSQ